MGIFTKLMTSVSGPPPEALPEHALLIDVRSPDEFASGHIEDAVSLPLDRVASGIGAIVADRNAPVIVYCRSGARSASARQQLLAMGYAHVVNGGGLQALSSRMNRKICY